jgi:hypothetical protein
MVAAGPKAFKGEFERAMYYNSYLQTVCKNLICADNRNANVLIS